MLASLRVDWTREILSIQKNSKLHLDVFKLAKYSCRLRPKLSNMYFFRNFEFWYLLLALEKFPTPNVYTRIVIPKQHGCITKDKMKLSVTTSQVMSI